MPGPQVALEITKKMAAASGVKLSAQAIVGGCCATTLDDIEGMRAVLSGTSAEPAPSQAHRP